MARRTEAVLFREGSDTVAVEEIELDGPRRNEVTVELAACGVCHSDLSATNGTIRMPLPLILGHEAAGVVVEVGDGVTDLEVGDHVVSIFVSICRRCRYCVTGRPSLCDQAAKAAATLPDGTVRTRDLEGNTLHVFSGCGVMARHATLHVDSVVEVDREIPLARAALIGCGVMTGVGAVFNTAGLEPGATAAVFGAGGVGLNAVQACAIAGATQIVAVDPSDRALEMAERFGATHTVNPTAVENVVKAIRALTGGGVDYSFECVGNGEVVAQAYGALGKGGTAVAVGVAPPGDRTSIGTAGLVFAEKTLKGSYFGSARPRDDFPRLLALYRSGRLLLDELVTGEYAIEDAPRAFADLVEGKNARGVIDLLR
jgi:Zn-dependent alcohol dehydrogenase